MDVPISQFRRELFSLMNQALEGADVWVTHKGRRLRIVPEKPVDKLSRITPMQVVAPSADLEDDSWKAHIARDWEQKWDHRLKQGPAAGQPASGAEPAKARKSRRSA